MSWFPSKTEKAQRTLADGMFQPSSPQFELLGLGFALVVVASMLVNGLSLAYHRRTLVDIGRLYEHHKSLARDVDRYVINQWEAERIITRHTLYIERLESHVVDLESRVLDLEGPR